MSVDLNTQVRDYTEFFMGTVESIDLEEIKERPFPLEEGPVPPLASPSRHRGWLVAVGGAVAVLVLGLLTFLTRQTAPEVPVASQPSPSPTVAAPAPVPSMPVEESVSDWSQVPHDETVFGGAGAQRIRSVTAGGPGLVAVGADGCCADVDAAVWTSVDGITWSRVLEHEAVFGGGEMSSVTTGGPGLVAVGDAAQGAAVWTSVDGITWSRVPEDEAVFGNAMMSSVTAGGPGLVAVGGDGFDAVVWASPDGLVWSRVPPDVSVFGGAYMSSVTAGGPGLVAVGWFEEDADENAGDNQYLRGAAVWTSPDGLVWSRVPHDEAVFEGGSMSSVTAGGPGLVAVGSRFAFRGGGIGLPVWTSHDGLTWSQVPDDIEVWQYESLESITAGGPGLVAVGPHVWTSPNGTNWSRVPADQDFLQAGIDSVTAGGPGLVAVGTTGIDHSPAIWVTTIED